MAEPEEAAVLVLEDFDSHWIEGGSSCAGSEVPIVNCFGIFSAVVCCAVLRANEEVIIIFVQVDDTEAMNPGIAGFFFDHSVHYLLPSGIAVGVLDAVLEHVVVDFPDFVAGFCEVKGFGAISL